jgi:hypothetical protein
MKIGKTTFNLDANLDLKKSEFASKFKGQSKAFIDSNWTKFKEAIDKRKAEKKAEEKDK